MRTSQLFFSIILMMCIGSPLGFASDVVIKANDDTITGVVVSGSYTFSNLTDNDVSSEPIYLLHVSKPAHGSAVVRPGNVVIYTPSASFKGVDSFTYQISSEPNDGGVTSEAEVTIINPYLLNRGTYFSGIIGAHKMHEDSGYLTLSVDAFGQFTAKLRYAGKSYEFKAAFDADSGHYTASIVRDSPLPSLSLDLQFALDGSPTEEGASKIDCILKVGAETTSFTASLNQWSSANPPSIKGRYTFIMPSPDLRATTPKATGFGTLTIDSSGNVTVIGRTGDNRIISSASRLKREVINDDVNIDAINVSVIPLYIPLYEGNGSIFGDLMLNWSEANDVELDASLVWTRQRNPKAKIFPRGFIRTIKVRGSNYIAPKPNTGVLEVEPPESEDLYNAEFSIFGLFKKPKTERALLGNQPDVGPYRLDFDNSMRFQASLTIRSINGTFSGSFTDVRSKKIYTLRGVFLQKENTAEGMWANEIFYAPAAYYTTRTGSVLLHPYQLTSPVP